MIQTQQPFKLVKTDKDAGVKVITELVGNVWTISKMLEPIMPVTAAEIQRLIIQHKMPETPLFLRKE